MAALKKDQEDKKVVFISHINEELPIAKAIRQELKSHFGNWLEVFLSEAISFGEDWQKSINSKLKEAHLLLVLFSPDAVDRPWINIEAGYGIINKTKVIPLYCLGLDQDKLHYIYQRLLGIEITDSTGVKKLFRENILAELLKDKNIEDKSDHWVKSWEANVVKVTADYSNQRVIKVKLPFQSYFQILNEFDNRCLDVFSWRKEEKWPIIGYSPHGGNNQLWQLQKTDEIYFRITSKHSKLCLAAEPGDIQHNTGVRQYKYMGDYSQQWDLTQITNDSFKITSRKYPDSCITIIQDKMDPNTSQILLSPWAHRPEQRWTFRVIATVIPV